MKKNEEASIGFIVGVEADVPLSFGEKWKASYHSPLQMCQWTMASAPGMFFDGY